MQVNAITPHISTTDLGPTIGCSNVTQNTVDLAVNELIRICSNSYLRHIGQVFENFKENREVYKNKEIGPSVNLPELRLCTPWAGIAGTHSKEERYSARLWYNINDLDETNQFGAVVVQLSRRIADLGFPCSTVEVRFEKGWFDSHADHWHLDGAPTARAITTCFSTKEHWTTWVVDEKKAREVFGIESIRGLPYNFPINEFESIAQPSKFGFLYNAIEVLHRSPKLGDLRDRHFSTNDYRLFMRFT